LHPILFHLTLPWIGVVPIKSFGVMVMLGVIAGSLWLGRALRRVGITDKDASSDLVTWAVITGLLGARITYIVIHPDSVESPLDVIALWKGGIVSYGGFFGGAVGMIWWARKKKLPLARVADCIGPALFLGQAFGRVGCFLVGDDYGKVVPPSCENLPWPITLRVPNPLPDASLFGRENAGKVLWATENWMSMKALLIAFIGWQLLKRRRYGGQVALWIVLLYALLRGTVEFFRGDTIRGLWFGGTISTSQLIGIVMAAISITLLVKYRQRRDEPRTA